MKKLKDKFQKIFSIPIPRSLLPLDKIWRVCEKLEYSLLLGSSIAIQRPYILQADIKPFIDSCPKDYYLIGFWGHGVNSYAFHYSLVDEWRKIFFRLPYGGVYVSGIANKD